MIPGASPDWEWGAWMLGDMSDVLRRVCDVVGRTSEIERVEVRPPTTKEALPQVTITVPTEGGVVRLRRALKSCEYDFKVRDSTLGRRWVAVVLGLRLVVTHSGDEAR